MVKDEILLKEYYSHLQHTENQRTKFFTIYLTITGAGIIGPSFFELEDPFKLLLFASMIAVTWFGLDIMEKTNEVVTAYTDSIIKILESDNPVYSFRRELPLERTVSKSRAYIGIFRIFLIVFSIMTGVYFSILFIT